MSRISETFARLRAQGRAGLVTFVTAGDPDAERSARILETLDQAGVDVLEVGVPFSDPLADGPVIQRATERALASGTTLAGVLDLVGRVRATLQAPVVIFSYANPILRMGAEQFADRAREAGVDGVFLEVHDQPAMAKSDGQNALALEWLEPLLDRLVQISRVSGPAAPTRA